MATLLCVHPLPPHGGMMDSHVIRKAPYRLPAPAGIAVLRFNTRATESAQGVSGGAFDGAQGERYDVAAAIEFAEFAELPDIWLLGWSFGTDLVLMYGCDPAVTGAPLSSPPLRLATDAGLDVWGESGTPAGSPLPREWDGPMETADSSAYADRAVATFADTPVSGPEDR